jgi:hypothetical protein
VRPLLCILSLFLATAGCGHRDDAPDPAAREVGGPEAGDARRFEAEGVHWMAVEVPADSAQLEIVVARRSFHVWNAAERPGLLAGDSTGRLGESALWGIDDADGDRSPEVWSARIVPSGAGYRLDLRAWSPRRRMLYRMTVPGGPEPEVRRQREFSFNVVDVPAVQDALTRRASSIWAAWSARPRP